mmetsp:Transcript_42501/g.104184  ORF Transcript_42501/g.104184 Transcript_42501/m.104184 type:complete len:80 (+) Transcript_42501:318-557(+)
MKFLSLHEKFRVYMKIGQERSTSCPSLFASLLSCWPLAISSSDQKARHHAAQQGQARHARDQGLATKKQRVKKSYRYSH